MMKPRFFDSIPFPSTNLRPLSEKYEDYAKNSLEMAFRINTCVEEMRKLEEKSKIKPLTREELREYNRMANVLGTYDAHHGETLLEIGQLKDKWIDRLFAA